MGKRKQDMLLCLSCPHKPEQALYSISFRLTESEQESGEEEEDDAELQALMGFGGFGSSK